MRDTLITRLRRYSYDLSLAFSSGVDVLFNQLKHEILIHNFKIYRLPYVYWSFLTLLTEIITIHCRNHKTHMKIVWQNEEI